MSDIAFLLLIFFLVTTIFALEEGIPLVLPASKAPPKKAQRDNIVTVQLHSNGTITIEGEVLTLEGVRSRVEARALANDRLIVVIESHPDSEYGVMVDVLDELRLANARRVSLKSMAVSASL